MAYTGLTAKLTIKAADIATETEVAYISNFSIEETRDIVEITKLGAMSKEKIASMYSWSASADGTADFEKDTTQLALRNAMINGKQIDVKFFLSTSPSRSLSGKALVESLSLDISAEDKGNISISLSGIGELTMDPAQTPST